MAADESDKILKILVQLNVLGDQDVKAAKELLGDMNKDMGVVNVTQEQANKILDESAKATEKATVSKHALKEIVKKLTADFPLLGEAARMAFNPIVLAVAGPIIAFKIWQDRVESLKESMVEVEMPDLTDGLSNVHKATQEWQTLGEAIKNANAEFNKAEAILARNRDEIDQQLAADKKLLDLQKQKALASLELNKGNMSDAAYKVNKAQIEQHFQIAEMDKEKEARDARVAAKFNAAQDARNRALEADRNAKGVRVEDDEEEFKKGQAALQQRADALAEAEKKHKANAKEIQEKSSAEGLIPKVDAAFSHAYKYGLTTSFQSTEDEQNQMAEQAASQRAAVEAEIARRAARFKQREQFQTEAGNNAGVAQTIANELPFDVKNLNRENAVAKSVREYTAQRMTMDAEVVQAIRELQQQMKNAPKLHK